MRPERKRVLLTRPSEVRVAARVPAWIVPTVESVLVVTDVLISAFSFMTAFYLREGVPVLVKTSSGGIALGARFAPYGTLLLFVVCIRVLSLRYVDLYRLRGEFSFVDDWIRIFKAISAGSLLIIAVAFLYRGGFQYRAFSYARSIFVLDFLIALATIGAVRVLMRVSQTFIRQRQINLI